MDIAERPSGDKGIEWLDLEFWPESDFKVEHMDNQQFGWVAQQLDAAEHQQQHAQPNLDSAVTQEHLGPAHVAYGQYQHRGDQTMVGISGVRACSGPQSAVAAPGTLPKRCRLIA